MTVSASFTTFADPEPEALCLSFGKHRGQPLANVETSYLEWVKTADRITPVLLAAITAELATRTPKVPIQDRWRAPQGTPAGVTDLARLIIEAGGQELKAALGDDYRVDAAVQLLRHYIGMVELESDPGNLPF